MTSIAVTRLCLLQQVKLRKRQHLSDYFAGSIAIMQQIECVRACVVIDERQGQIAIQCLGHEPIGYRIHLGIVLTGSDNE